MGCTSTKEITDKKKVKEGSKNEVVRNLDEPPVPTAPDPRLPLNARQRFNISKSWKGIARAMESTGVSMFVRMFEENEEVLNLFEKFRELRTKESQRESLELAQHAGLVMTTLDESISSLDNMDYFLDYLHSVGKMHRKVPNFNREHFWRIEKPFLDAIQETLGDRYTDNMETIYKITIHFILETIIQGFDEGGPSAAPQDTNANSSGPTNPSAGITQNSV